MTAPRRAITTDVDGDAPSLTLVNEFSKPANMHARRGGPAAASATSISAAASAVRPRYCDSWWETIESKRAVGLTAQRIYQDLVAEHGFARSYSTVQRYVRRLEATQPLPFRRMECAPGEEPQIDFSVGALIITTEGKRLRTHVSRIVPSYSRRAYSEAVDWQTTDNFIRCLEYAFAHFGGAADSTDWRPQGGGHTSQLMEIRRGPLEVDIQIDVSAVAT